MLRLALIDYIASDICRQPIQYICSLRVPNIHFHASFFVIESDCLSRREVAANGEKFLGGSLLLGVARELVCNTNWERIVFLDFKVSHLEQGAQHGCRKRRTSGHTFEGVECAAALLDSKDFFNLLLDEGNTRSISYKFNTVDLLLLEARLGKCGLQHGLEVIYHWLDKLFKLSSLNVLMHIFILEETLKVNGGLFDS